MRLLIRLLLYTGSIITLFTMPSATSAQGGAISPTIGVSPGKLFETVRPGETSVFKIKLRNLGSDPIPLTATLSDIDSISEDGVPIFSEKASKRSAVDWITLENTEVIVAPGEHKQLTISITPPENAVPGGYTAAIFFQASLPSYYFDIDANTRIIPAISVITFFSIAGVGEITVDQLKIEELIVPNFVVSTPISLIAKIKNPSNFFIQADASATIKSVTGTADKQDIGRIIMLPEGTRRLVTAFEGGILPGFYTAEFELKQGDKVFIASARFFAFPWQSLVGLFIVLLIGLGLAGRRRLRSAWRILSGKPIPSKPRSRHILR